MNERKSDGQDTTDGGTLSDPWAFHTQYVGDFAFTEIDKNTRSIRMDHVSPSDLQNYRDIIMSITNDKNLLDNYGALRMARHIDSRVKTIRTLNAERDALQRTVAGMDARLQLDKAALAAWCNGPLPLWLKERVTQTRLHTEEVNGNCMAACFASVLGGDISEYDAIIDAVIGGNWWHAVEELWRSHGYLIMRISASASDWSGGPDALCFASGTSPRGVRHMCVYAGGEIIHDPHPSRAGLTEITDYSILVPWRELTTPTREGSTDAR